MRTANGKTQQSRPSKQASDSDAEVYQSTDHEQSQHIDNSQTIGKDSMKKALEYLGFYPNAAELESIMTAMPGRCESLEYPVNPIQNPFDWESVHQFQETAGLGRLSHSELRQTFDFFDSDKRGYLSVETMLKMMTYFGCEVSREEMEDMIASLNPSMPDRIGFEEFSQFLTQ